jgi:large subunit ribosomal protein L9
MEVILLERIEKLGQMGELVKVKPGFARNYLLPQGKALRANAANLARYEEQKSQLDAANLERRGDAEGAAAKLNDFICVLLRQASDSDQLYGSVTARDISNAASESGVSIDRNQILLDRPIKTLGIHPIRVALHPEVIVTIGVNVARTTEEADTQELASRRPAAKDDAADTDHVQEEEAPSVEEIFERPEDVQIDEDGGEEGESEAGDSTASDNGAADGDGDGKDKAADENSA